MGDQRLAHFFRRTPLPCGKIKSFSWFIILIDLEKRVVFRYITVTPRRLLTDSWHLIYCKKQVHICLEWLRSQNGQNLGNTLVTFSKDSLTFVSTVIIFKPQCVVRRMEFSPITFVRLEKTLPVYAACKGMVIVLPTNAKLRGKNKRSYKNRLGCLVFCLSVNP